MKDAILGPRVEFLFQKYNHVAAFNVNEDEGDQSFGHCKWFKKGACPALLQDGLKVYACSAPPNMNAPE